IGADNNPVSLKEEIRRLFASPPAPIINDIQFLRKLSDGKTETVEFKKSYRAKWEPANRTKIAGALDWLRPYLTDRDKSCTDYTWNSGGSEPGIIFWEDNSKNNTRCSSLGTYIVNGGELSPVISFQPKFSWN